MRVGVYRRAPCIEAQQIQGNQPSLCGRTQHLTSGAVTAGPRLGRQRAWLKHPAVRLQVAARPFLRVSVLFPSGWKHSQQIERFLTMGKENDGFSAFEIL